MRDDQRSYMKRLIISATCLFAALFIISLIPACTENDLSGPPNHHENQAGKLVSYTDCKLSQNAQRSGGAVPIMDCAEYHLQDGALLLKHVNAGFNCCPGDISADITVRNDTVTIVERERDALCRCLCLYDLNYRFDDLEPRVYTFIFVEPYTTDADEPLKFTVDLSGSPSDTFCVDRHNYPWDTGGGTIEPLGTLISRTGCGTEVNSPPANDIPTDMSCIDWQYLTNNVLRMKHINAAFNCCPGDISADITIRSDTITIVERESQSMCDCQCLYDLEFEFRNIEPRPYLVKVLEPYAPPGAEKLEFLLDVTAFPSGIKCAYREYYPWMYLGSASEDGAMLDRMRRRIIDFIGVPSCGGENDCRYIGFGYKPCGGFSSYLVYSASAVDVTTLTYMVYRYNALAYGFDLRNHLGSDCAVVPPPGVGCLQGVCRDLNRTH
jgi:hypothetical protein